MTRSKLLLVASQPHYASHLLPIWDQIPDECKAGELLGVERQRPLTQSAPVRLVAGYADVQSAPGQPYVLVEHGAGQSYKGSGRPIDADGFYSGGRGHDYALGFICPNEEVARRWFIRYPDKPCAVVGSPRLDPWHAGLRGQPEDRTVAITFHWDAQFTGVPETQSLFGHYASALPDVIARWGREGWTVLGHWHPRAPMVEQFWRSLKHEGINVEVVSDSTEVLDRASVLVADNTSMQAEFLSLGRRVVWLNHDVYRADVEHGGRFWKWPQLGGLSIDSPAGLRRLDLDDVPAAHGHPYAFADGEASLRASLAIQMWLRDRDS